MLIKRYAIIRVKWGTELETEIWSDRFDTEQAAIEFLEHYRLGGESIIVPVYLDPAMK